MIIKAEFTQEEKKAIITIANMDCSAVGCNICPANVEEGNKCIKDYAEEIKSKL